MAKSKPRVPVTERAVVQRINRKLEPKLEAIRKIRSGINAGHYCYIDLNRNFLLSEVIDLEPFARECESLEEWEYLAEDDQLPAGGAAGEQPPQEQLLLSAARDEAKAKKLIARAKMLRAAARNSAGLRRILGQPKRRTAGGESGH